MARVVYYIGTPDGNFGWLRVGDAPVSSAEKKLTEIQHVQGPTVAWARRNGIRAIKLQGMGNKSLPDYMFMKDGQIRFIEFKRPGGIPSALQANTINAFQSEGFKIQVHDTKESAIEWLKELV